MNADTRQIFALMAFAAAFALVGETIKKKAGANKTGTDVKILLGGGLGAVLLVLLAQAGPEGASFAKGLAAITLVASVVTNGEVVFPGIDKLTGSVAKIGTTTPATPTIATKGTTP